MPILFVLVPAAIAVVVLRYWYSSSRISQYWENYADDMEVERAVLRIENASTPRDIARQQPPVVSEETKSHFSEDFRARIDDAIKVHNEASK